VKIVRRKCGDDMAYWGNSVKGKISPEPLFRIGDGVNTAIPPMEISKSEAVSSLNVMSDNYPALSVRKGMAKSFGTTSAPVTTMNAFGMLNPSELHVVDGGTWKRWSGGAWVEVDASVVGTGGTLMSLITEATSFMLMFNSSIRLSWNGTTVTSLTAAPITPLIAVKDNKVYAAKGGVLYCSAAGDPTDWTTVNDADEIPLTGIIGDATAIIAYRDMIITFGERTMHLLLGQDPLNYQMQSPIGAGCLARQSLVVSNDILYFIDGTQFKEFTGGIPREVGQKVRSYLQAIPFAYRDKICMSGNGKYVYISIPYGATNNNITLVYDTEFKTWYPIDRGFLGFVTISRVFYGIDTSGVIWELNNGTADTSGAIYWSHITGVWTKGILKQTKVISDFYIIVDLPVGSTLTMYYSTSYDSVSDWVELGGVTPSAIEQKVRIQVPTTELQGINWYRLKFSGSGPCTIFEIEPHIRIKGA
jgi:hypothetical protein